MKKNYQKASLDVTAKDPKDHLVQCNITVSANDYETIKATLPTKYFDELELKREIGIMNEVREMPGYTMLDKVDNAIEAWSHERQTTVRGNVRYKLKYKY